MKEFVYKCDRCGARSPENMDITFEIGSGVDASGDTCTRGYACDLCIVCKSKLLEKVFTAFRRNETVEGIFKSFVPTMSECEW